MKITAYQYLCVQNRVLMSVAVFPVPRHQTTAETADCLIPANYQRPITCPSTLDRFKQTSMRAMITQWRQVRLLLSSLFSLARLKKHNHVTKLRRLPCIASSTATSAYMSQQSPVHSDSCLMCERYEVVGVNLYKIVLAVLLDNGMCPAIKCMLDWRQA